MLHLMFRNVKTIAKYKYVWQHHFSIRTYKRNARNSREMQTTVVVVYMPMFAKNE